MILYHGTNTYFEQIDLSFKKHEISIIEGIIEENVEVIIDRWKNFFSAE